MDPVHPTPPPQLGQLPAPAGSALTAPGVSPPERWRNEPSANRTWVITAWVLGLSLVGLFTLCGYQLVRTVNIIGTRTDSSEYFVLTSIALLNSGLLRFLAMLIGVAIAAGGLLVSFLTISESVGLSGSAGGVQPALSAALKTNSPGTVGLVAGCFIVCFAVYFRPEFSAAPPEVQDRPAERTVERPARLEDPPPLPSAQPEQGTKP